MIKNHSLTSDGLVSENMEENEANEQFFYDKKTLKILADIAEKFEYPCLLCAPTLGDELIRRGRKVRILDIDMRFSRLKGFWYFDINNPKGLGEKYDLIICDPPFTIVAIEQLFYAVKRLSRNNQYQKILISWEQQYLKEKFMKIFSYFNLRLTGFCLTYRQGFIPFPDELKQEYGEEVIVELYSNFPAFD
jgi:hypothetical protein